MKNEILDNVKSILANKSKPDENINGIILCLKALEKEAVGHGLTVSALMIKAAILSLEDELVIRTT